MESEIKPGDVVVLKSDNEHKLKMTVKFVGKDKAECYYADSSSFQIKKIDIDRNDIPIILLQKIG